MCNYSLSVTCHISATQCTYIYRHVKQVQICMTYTHTHIFILLCHRRDPLICVIWGKATRRHFNVAFSHSCIWHCCWNKFKEYSECLISHVNITECMSFLCCLWSNLHTSLHIMQLSVHADLKMWLYLLLRVYGLWYLLLYGMSRCRNQRLVLHCSHCKLLSNNTWYLLSGLQGALLVAWIVCWKDLQNMVDRWLWGWIWSCRFAVG